MSVVISIARGDKDELAINSGPFDLIMTKWFILSFEFVVSFVRRTFKFGRVENFMPFNSVNKVTFVVHCENTLRKKLFVF